MYISVLGLIPYWHSSLFRQHTSLMPAHYADLVHYVDTQGYALLGSGGDIEEEELCLGSSFFRHIGRKPEPEPIPTVATDSALLTGNRRCFMGIFRSRGRYRRCGRSDYTWGGDGSNRCFGAQASRRRFQVERPKPNDVRGRRSAASRRGRSKLGREI
ncbi:hypothetical protein U1Q18_022925 [Sarracenia purpurea var. burkii]